MVYTCDECGMPRGKKTCHTCQLFDVKAKLS